jgi:hypothetical protein
MTAGLPPGFFAGYQPMTRRLAGYNTPRRAVLTLVFYAYEPANAATTARRLLRRDESGWPQKRAEIRPITSR